MMTKTKTTLTPGPPRCDYCGYLLSTQVINESIVYIHVIPDGEPRWTCPTPGVARTAMSDGKWRAELPYNRWMQDINAGPRPGPFELE